MENLKGKFITFEGGEGVGKSTQSKLLVEELNKKGIKAVWTREPGGCDDAEEIRKLIVSGSANRWDGITELLLIYAARRVHTEKKIKPLLKDGVTVISDRYFDSSLAYQGFGHNLPIENVETIRKIALEDFKPDVTIFLDMDTEAALMRTNKRGDKNRFEDMELSFHKKVKDGFEYILSEENERFIRIDVTNITINELNKIIINKLTNYFDYKTK